MAKLTKIALLLLILTAFSRFPVSSADAATIYVDPESKCQTGCGSYFRPYQSINDAQEAAKEGDRIIMKSKPIDTLTTLTKTDSHYKELGVSVQLNKH